MTQVSFGCHKWIFLSVHVFLHSRQCQQEPTRKQKQAHGGEKACPRDPSSTRSRYKTSMRFVNETPYDQSSYTEPAIDYSLFSQTISTRGEIVVRIRDKTSRSAEHDEKFEVPNRWGHLHVIRVIIKRKGNTFFMHNCDVVFQTARWSRTIFWPTLWSGKIKKL